MLKHPIVTRAVQPLMDVLMDARDAKGAEPTIECFGYASKIFRDDDAALDIEGRLISIDQADDPVTVDRYDVRLLVDDRSVFERPAMTEAEERTALMRQLNPDETLHDIDHERYKDLPDSDALIPSPPLGASSSAQDFSAVPLDYGQTTTDKDTSGDAAMMDHTEGEAQASGGGFCPPFAVDGGVRVMPATKKEHLIIEHTAHFVRKEGDRMEFQLKLRPDIAAKLPFLDVEHPLHPYYVCLKQSGQSMAVSHTHMLPPKWRDHIKGHPYYTLPATVKKDQPASIQPSAAAGAAKGGKSAAAISLGGLLSEYGDSDSDEADKRERGGGDVTGAAGLAALQDERRRRARELLATKGQQPAPQAPPTSSRRRRFDVPPSLSPPPAQHNALSSGSSGGGDDLYMAGSGDRDRHESKRKRRKRERKEREMAMRAPHPMPVEGDRYGDGEEDRQPRQKRSLSRSVSPERDRSSHVGGVKKPKRHKRAGRRRRSHND
ncbi:unnamed protein product [Vitrella brassicaformis CCMP3155]|uniref:SURP motif domain-containing protein n=1 Tax=Vitrella brassicaformis (strain CCMP3155) TaxID=1169540 RepID=A0A0G4FGF5_VITBC|nr:unnamed protein product [Vitrella brassicaformis CCMP3155]|eukprot:CEM11914.1 unnamed protein product [Vitrella brassicaformis CCMP3155]